MRTLSWWVIAASSVVRFAVGQTVVDKSDLATVTVVVSDTFGKSIPGAKVTLTSVGPNEKFTAVGGEAKFEHIPFGRYDVDVRLVGFEPRKERVRVYQPNVVINAGLEPGATHSYERPEMSGSVRPDLKGRLGLWVRLVAIYSSDLVENAVDSSGHFELNGMAAGKYLLVLFEKDKVLASKPVDVLGGKQATELTIESQ